MAKCILALMLVALAPLAYSQTGGGYDLSWFTLEPGTTSTGGNYRLTGVAGQPDAGTMSGGSYSLTGGFLTFFPTTQSSVADWTLYESE